MPFELPREEIPRSFRDWANSMWEDVYMRPSIVNKSRGLCRSFAPNKVWYTSDMDKNIDPGKGYRLLEDGEIIKHGDEQMFHLGEWEPTYESSIGDPVDEHDRNLPRRRKITKKRVEVTSDFRKGDIAVLPSGEEVVFTERTLSVSGWYISSRTFDALGIKVYREVEPKKLRCYPQTVVRKGSTEGMFIDGFEKDERIWISNKEPLTFKEED